MTTRNGPGDRSGIAAGSAGLVLDDVVTFSTAVLPCLDQALHAGALNLTSWLRHVRGLITRIAPLVPDLTDQQGSTLRTSLTLVVSSARSHARARGQSEAWLAAVLPELHETMVAIMDVQWPYGRKRHRWTAGVGNARRHPPRAMVQER